MPTLGCCDPAVKMGSQPDGSLAFLKLDLQIVADAKCSEDKVGGALEMHILFLMCLSQSVGPFLKRCIGGSELTPSVPALTPVTGWRKPSLYSTPLDGR